MRYDINQSTLSPPVDLDLSRPCESSLENRPPLSNNPHPWRALPRDRLESESSYHSLRTMSLTSMSGRYSSASLRAPCLPLAPKKPLFYDYSEDFEEVVESPQVSPIAPIPRHTSTTLRPLIAENDHDTLSDRDAEDGPSEDILSCLRRVTMIEDVDDDDDSGSESDEYRPVSRSGPRPGSVQPAPRNAGRIASITMPASRQEDETAESLDTSPVVAMKRGNVSHNSAPKVDAITTEAHQNAMLVHGSTVACVIQPDTSAIGFDTTRSEPPGFRDERCTPVKQRADDSDLKQGGAISGETVKGGSFKEDMSSNALKNSPPAGASSNRYSDYRKDSRLFSLSSGLSDLASFVKYIDRHIQSPDTEEYSQEDTSAIPASKTAPSSDFGSTQTPNGKTMPPPPRKSSLRPCGIYNTELKTSSGPSLDDELNQFQVVSTRSGPTLVPQPISPAKMLRVKNSIPHLMKALPPLPGYSPAPESPFGPAVVPIDFEPFEISRLTDARSTLTEAILLGRRGHSEDAPKGHDPFVFDRRAHKPRLRLKHAASCASGNSRDLRRGYFEQSGTGLSAHPDPRPSTAGNPSHAPIKRRLPIKISRTALMSSGSEETGTVRRRPGLKKSSTVSELTSKQPMDLFGDPMTPKGTDTSVPHPMAVKPQNTPLKPVPQRTPIGEGQRHVHEKVPPLPSTEARLLSSDFPRTESESHGEMGMQSFFSDNDINTPRRGLRTRISDLRAKLSEPRIHQQSHLRNGASREKVSNESHMQKHEVSSTNTFKDLFLGMGQSKGHHKNSSDRKVRSKLGRFMQGAKHKLRAWGQHRRGID